MKGAGQGETAAAGEAGKVALSGGDRAPGGQVEFGDKEEDHSVGETSPSQPRWLPPKAWRRSCASAATKPQTGNQVGVGGWGRCRRQAEQRGRAAREHLAEATGKVPGFSSRPKAQTEAARHPLLTSRQSAPGSLQLPSHLSPSPGGRLSDGQ